MHETEELLLEELVTDQEKFCISCERLLPKVGGIGEIDLICFRKLKAGQKIIRGEIVVLFPFLCPHEGHKCRENGWGILMMDARTHRWLVAGGPYPKRKARAEARRLRAEAVRRRTRKTRRNSDGEARPGTPA